MITAGICDFTPNYVELADRYNRLEELCVIEYYNTSTTSVDAEISPSTYINGNLYPYNITSVNNVYNAYMKTYESYKLFNHNSNQYRLQQMCYTDENGLRYIDVDGQRYYCCAVGTAVSETIGQLGYLELENGEIINIIVSDVKRNQDTNSDNIVTSHSHCASEFVVDVNSLNSTWKRMGCVFYEKDNVVNIGMFDCYILD